MASKLENTFLNHLTILFCSQKPNCRVSLSRAHHWHPATSPVHALSHQHIGTSREPTCGFTPTQKFWSEQPAAGGHPWRFDVDSTAYNDFSYSIIHYQNTTTLRTLSDRLRMEVNQQQARSNTVSCHRHVDFIPSGRHSFMPIFLYSNESHSPTHFDWK